MRTKIIKLKIMKRMELPKATKKEFAKRAMLVELLQKDDSDPINMKHHNEVLFSTS
jgi:hypothetical protein